MDEDEQLTEATLPDPDTDDTEETEEPSRGAGDDSAGEEAQATAGAASAAGSLACPSPAA